VRVARAAKRTSEGLRLHGKAVVVDNRLAIVGSQSLSRKSLDLRRELSLILSDPRHVRALEQQIAGLTPQPVGLGGRALLSGRAA
jgi:phosphatidylserine/phosphatidylglycerophosphate/cardiolipin synthase-like enzyme